MSGKSSTEEPSDNLAEIVRLIEGGNNLDGAGKYPDAEIHCKTSGINSHDYSETLFVSSGGFEVLAERVGFEPTVGVNPLRFSRPVH